jgi:ketosteroid isomerase-like protein
MNESDSIAVVRRLMDAYQRDDLKAQLAALDPDVELVEWPAGPDPATYRGHAGIVRARESWSEAWEALSWEINEMIDGGDRVFVAVQMKAKGRGSSIEVDAETYAVFTLRDGIVTKGQFFTERQQALEAAGLGTADAKAAISEEAR